MSRKESVLVFVINTDWYFNLHWLDRANYFKSIGFTVHIITTFVDRQLNESLLERGFYCHGVALERNSINVLSELKYILELKRVLDRIDPDLIHSVTVKPNIYTGFLNYLFFNKPIVYGVTGLGALFTSRNLKLRIIRRFVIRLYRFISSKQSKFVFENSEDCSRFEKLGILKFDNGIVIKGAGIDLELFTPEIKKFDSSLLFAARLLEDKGLRELIEAKKIISKRYGYDFNLNVAGIIDLDVTSAISLKDIDCWNSDGHICWLGNVSDMPSLINSNDIVCLPTKYGEGVPRILIEAGACGKAIITTNVPGCRELVKDKFNGLLVEPNNIEALAESIYFLLKNPEQCVLFGDNGRTLVEKEFSQEIVFHKTLKVYQELLSF